MGIRHKDVNADRARKCCIWLLGESENTLCFGSGITQTIIYLMRDEKLRVRMKILIRSLKDWFQSMNEVTIMFLII